MAPTSHYNYLVIGGGSGGVASSRRAAKYGARSLVIEGREMGGTCVNVGCVPKKVMWSASDLATKVHYARGYDFDVPDHPKFDWTAFKKKRDAYVERLRGIYERNLTNEHVDFVYGWAEFVDAHTVRVKLRDGGEATYTADYILVASGGEPQVPTSPKGADLGSTSDGFFELETQPESVAVVGAGYIGTEFAGVFNGLGTNTHLFIRGQTLLRSFDEMLQRNVTDTYVKEGIHIHKGFKFSGDIVKVGNKIRLTYTDSENEEPTHVDVDKLIWTIGRHPSSDKLGLGKLGVKVAGNGKILVDEYQQSSVPNIFSLGDVAEDVELTPVAIAAGRMLSDRLFGGKKDAKLDYTNIPTAVFSHPELGSVGLTEAAARKEYGDDIKVYTSRFINMFYSPLPQDEKLHTEYKIVCAGPEEKVVGLHLFGDGSAEILQGFGVAIKMGATKADFDSCIAIHPTAAEELVTMK